LARELAWGIRPAAAGIGRRRLLTAAVSLASPLAIWPLVGCKSAPPPPPPASVSGRITAVAGLNPSVTQRPSPLRLRLYELKSPTSFNQADFMALYQSDQATLGPDMVAREEFVLQPGEARPYAKTLAPETRYIGIVAIYRDLERATWRTLVPVQAAKAQTLQIRADSLAVSATMQ